MFVPLDRFAPDADPTTPGVITACSNIIHTKKGYRSAYSGSTIALPALAAACRGAASLERSGGSNRLFAGTQTKLYQAGSTSWTDVSKAGDYTGSSTSKWRFCQFGNVTIAVNKTDATQYIDSGADFADLSGAPKASICESVLGFVFLLGTNDGTYGDQPDRWWCSALEDYTAWTPSIATQSATNRFYDTPGPITAGRRIGDYLAVFKKRAIYLGQYVGPDQIWRWSLITDRVGAVNQEASVSLEEFVLFMGDDGFWVFDGASVRPIDDDIREWFFTEELDTGAKTDVRALHDADKKIVYWHYQRRGTSGLTAWVAYNYQAGRWGNGTLTIECPIEYLSSSITYDDLGTLYSTYDDLPDIPYDSNFWLGGARSPAYFDSSHRINLWVGDSGSSSLTTGDFGQDDDYTFIERVRPRFLTTPTTATMTNYYRNDIGGSLTTDTTTTIGNRRFDFMREAIWHRAKLDFTGNMAITGLDVQTGMGSDE